MQFIQEAHAHRDEQQLKVSFVCVLAYRRILPTRSKLSTDPIEPDSKRANSIIHTSTTEFSLLSIPFASQLLKSAELLVGI